MTASIMQGRHGESHEPIRRHWHGRITAVVGRAGRRSRSEQFHLYTRASLYLLTLLEPVLVGIWLVATPAEQTGGHLFWVIAGACLVHTATCVCLPYSLPARPELGNWIQVSGAAAATMVASAVVLELNAEPSQLSASSAELLLAGALVFLTGPLSIAWPPKAALALLTMIATTVGLSGVVLGTEIQLLAGAGLYAVIGGAAFALTYRFSAWAVGVVLELGRSQEIQARLAVAEERLRFARDLHDVLGRNLTVIALKSELAAALSGQGAPADQMVEIQRIAHQSQEEVRAVVTGYRSADLRTELEGARAVLHSAGIRCLVSDPEGLGAGAPQALGWAVREGVTNVLRHSEARQCLIELSSQGGTLTLTMENDGVYGPLVPGTGGSGLAGLRERLAPLDGTVSGCAKSESQFLLTVCLPWTSRLSATGHERRGS
ncbi:sensor histidine kinase [Streptomyces goshikiensis]|uniref:sensor histidine kinase n=1 Tax=Streptomyces TaxID=1883 RepID=UPI0020B375E7|nr:histidine kinase [Streptomyces sp. ADI95-16]